MYKKLEQDALHTYETPIDNNGAFSLHRQDKMHLLKTVCHTTKNLVKMQQPEGFLLPAACRPLFSVIDAARTGLFVLLLFDVVFDGCPGCSAWYVVGFLRAAARLLLHLRAAAVH